MVRLRSAHEFIWQASGQYLTKHVQTTEEVTEDILWEPFENWPVEDVCSEILQAAQVIADCVNTELSK